MPSASARSSASRFPALLTLIILLVVIGVVGWQWLHRKAAPPEPTPATPQAAPISQPPPPRRTASTEHADTSLQVLVQRQDATIQEQTERIAELEAEVARWKAEAERYQQGLGRAVDELNRQVAESPPSTSAPTRYRRQPEPYLSSVLGPRVHINGADVVVSGRVHNAGDAPGDARLSVELLLDGRSVDEQWIDLRVGVGSTQSYQLTFPGRAGQTGTWSAHVEIR